jgi:hypothetical protein
MEYVHLENVFVTLDMEELVAISVLLLIFSLPFTLLYLIVLVPPIIQVSNDTVIMENIPYASPPVVLVQGNPTPSYFFANSPPQYMYMNPTTGVITWSQPKVGIYNIAIRVFVILPKCIFLNRTSLGSQRIL